LPSSSFWSRCPYAFGYSFVPALLHPSPAEIGGIIPACSHQGRRAYITENGLGPKAVKVYGFMRVCSGSTGIYRKGDKAERGKLAVSHLPAFMPPHLLPSQPYVF